MSVYKSEKPEYLDLALRSVWTDQSLKPAEIILVEDGPIGKELHDIIDNWKNVLKEKFILIVNETNLGLTKSLNKAINKASGEYLARMDSDDISVPNRFELQKKFLDENKEISVVGGFVQEFDSNHQNLGIRHFPSSEKDIVKYIHKASPLAHPTVMMRKDIFRKGLSYNEKYKTSQDIALWFDVLKLGYKIGNVKHVTLYFRREGDVFKRRSRQKAKNELIIYLRGIYSIDGVFTWRYIYPLARFIFRLMPVSIVKYIYGSGLREKIVE